MFVADFAGLGALSFESSEYIRTPRLICRRLFVQVIRLALSLALLTAANNKDARMEMMAMTTSNSISVNPVSSSILCHFGQST